MTGDRFELAAFIAARLDDDERIATATACTCGGPACTIDRWYGADEALHRLDSMTAARHVMRHSPARVLADVTAKRAILAHAAAPVTRFTPDSDPCPWPTIYTSRDRVYADPHLSQDVTDAYDAWCATRAEPAHPDVLRYLAAPYADHPDYRQEWRP